MPLLWLTNTAVLTSNYSATEGDFVVCNPTGGAFAITIPLSADCSRMIVIKNQSASTNNITLTRSGSNTIDGATTFVMNVARQAIILIPDRVSDWMII